MDKNCLNCYNFKDGAEIDCEIMTWPPDDYFCFVADAKKKLEQERDCLRYAINHGSIQDIQQQTKRVITLMRATQ
jgi:hypothetical protein